MFWIFQDKDRFRFGFVEHEAFSQKMMRRLLYFLASFPYTVILVKNFILLLPPPDATFQLEGAKQDQSRNIGANYCMISLNTLHP